MTLDELPVEDQCLVHRYLYYVMARPVLTDWEYSKLEVLAFIGEFSDDHPLWKPGSDRAEDYPAHIIEIASAQWKI